MAVTGNEWAFMDIALFLNFLKYNIHTEKFTYHMQTASDIFTKLYTCITSTQTKKRFFNPILPPRNPSHAKKESLKDIFSDYI